MQSISFIINDPFQTRVTAELSFTSPGVCNTLKITVGDLSAIIGNPIPSSGFGSNKPDIHKIFKIIKMYSVRHMDKIYAEFRDSRLSFHWFDPLYDNNENGFSILLK